MQNLPVLIFKFEVNENGSVTRGGSFILRLVDIFVPPDYGHSSATGRIMAHFSSNAIETISILEIDLVAVFTATHTMF